jgi:guanine nucleotide-binding protein G(i) subunit alpha
MVEPLTIIGTAAAVVGIIESIAKALSTLHDLRGQWKQADLRLVNLEVQLLALKTALGKIGEWLKPGLDEVQDPCHELVLTVGTVIQCCNMLATMLDAEVSEFSRNTDSSLDAQSRMKFLSKNGTLEELQTMVDRQTNALTLLLTACNWLETHCLLVYRVWIRTHKQQQSYF